MRSQIIIACVLMIAASPAVAAGKYRCKDFAADYKATPERETVDTRSNPSMAMAAGFLMGSYYARTGDDFLSKDTKGLGTFEKQVVEECAKNPGERVPVVVLKLAEGLLPASTGSSSKSTGEYNALSLTDFRLDADDLIGKKIEVSGILQTMGDMSMLGEELFTMNKVFVDTKKLPRDSRRFIIEKCEQGCQITVRGKAGKVLMNNGIIAEAITPQ